MSADVGPMMDTSKCRFVQSAAWNPIDPRLPHRSSIVITLRQQENNQGELDFVFGNLRRSRVVKAKNVMYFQLMDIVDPERLLDAEEITEATIYLQTGHDAHNKVLSIYYEVTPVPFIATMEKIVAGIESHCLMMTGKYRVNTFTNMIVSRDE